MSEGNIHFNLKEDIRSSPTPINKIMTPADLEEYYKKMNDMGANVYDDPDTATHYLLNDITDIASMELNYKDNYTVKGLTHIIQYYGIAKNKMTKDEMIQTIVLHETDPINHEQVFTRLRLWLNISELKENPFFSKYILFDI